MSRTAAATAPAHDPRIKRSSGVAIPRRSSGPASDPHRAEPRPRTHLHPRPLRVVSGGGAALASIALNVSGSRAMDRLVRSRGWIVIVGFGLIGIVAMQVSLLKLNAGIGRAVETAATLERSNAELRLDVSKLSATDRVQRLAAERGFTMPAPADVGYIQSGDLARDGRRAAKNMRPPDPSAVVAAPTIAQPALPQTDSAVVANGPGSAAPNTATTIAPANADGTPATPGTQQTTTPPAQTPPVSGGATPATGATSSGGVAPPQGQ